jgi:hypothetical protein
MFSMYTFVCVHNVYVCVVCFVCLACFLRLHSVVIGIDLYVSLCIYYYLLSIYSH